MLSFSLLILLQPLIYCSPYTIQLSVVCNARNTRLAGVFEREGEKFKSKFNEIVVCAKTSDDFDECVKSLNLDWDSFLAENLKHYDKKVGFKNNPKHLENHLSNLFREYCSYLNSGGGSGASSTYDFHDDFNILLLLAIPLGVCFIYFCANKKGGNEMVAPENVRRPYYPYPAGINSPYSPSLQYRYPPRSPI